MSEARRATPEGTRRYAERMRPTAAPEHFRNANGLMMSTIGLGTYLGQWDEHTDRAYQEAIKRALELGCNVIDSAINYRFQRSERSIGAALKQLFDSGKLKRDEVIVATKGGFFSFDNEPPRDPRRWVIENLIDTGAARPEDFVDSHCMSPSYLENQMERSLANLGLDTIDIYYVHNPESQLEGVSREEFMHRVRRAFEFLERAASDGRIQFYGTATWSGYRQAPQSREYLSLSGMFEAAREVGGDSHRFRVIQLPYNLAMPEALTLANQSVDGQQLSAFEAATRLGMTVMCSASILQAKLAQNLPPFVGAALKGLGTDAQRAIQFVRSTPGVTTALVGMSDRGHVEENMLAARIPPASLEEFLKMFSES
ncbi:MAG TPA: aldo/keto reductase [Blastocatellia bacterium]|nr:aldo/keto reductase [Blastocatellia bacterium]